jgi:hypothetical protein
MSVFGRNFYDADETNQILEIGLALHCPIFWRDEVLLFDCCWFFKSSCNEFSHFDIGLILHLLQFRRKNKTIGMRTVK